MMLQPGDPVPDVELWLAPGEAVGLHALVRKNGPCFLFFYLLDWTST